MEKAERIGNIIHVDFARYNGPQMQVQSVDRAPQAPSESQDRRHLSLVSSSEKRPTQATSNESGHEGSAGVTFQAGSTKIDPRTGNGEIYVNGVSNTNTSDSVWDTTQIFAGRRFATVFDKAALTSQKRGTPRSRLAA